MTRPFVFFILGLAYILSIEMTLGETELQERIEELEATIERQNKEIEYLREQCELAKREIEEQKVRFVVRKLEQEVSQLRNLPFKRDVKFKTLSSQNLQTYIQEHIEDQLPGEQLQDYYLVLKVLGFINEEVNLKRLLMGVYSEQIAGAYDERLGTLYIMEQFGVEDMPAKVILAHELCHALQDQYFDLSSLPINRKDNDDVALAALAIIEGDAYLLTMDFMNQHMDVKSLLQFTRLLAMEQGQLLKAPEFFQKTLMFPYIQGMEFMHRIIAAKGDEGRNIVFRNLPRSTEQILHPEKYYLEVDEPTAITLPDLTLLTNKSWERKLANVVGEFSLRILCEKYYPNRKARQIASGWDGDQFCLYKKGEAFLLHWVSIWDSAKDAREFFVALPDMLMKNHRELKISSQKDDTRFLSSPRMWAKLELKKEKAVLIISDDKGPESIFWRRRD